MNRVAILAVADVIEWADRFDMSSWVTGPTGPVAVLQARVWDDCGTAACVGGWTAAWADRNPLKGSAGEIDL